jgi:thioredoxin 1
MQQEHDIAFQGTVPKFVIGALLTCLCAAILGSPGCHDASDSGSTGPSSTAGSATRAANTGLPRLVDLGAGKCIPCKRMAPILEELRTEYAGSLEVVFIDVWQNTDAAKQYNVETIPTQIFLDPSGKELFRHEGFFAKEEILAKWKELGFDLTEKRPAPASKET